MTEMLENEVVETYFLSLQEFGNRNGRMSTFKIRQLMKKGIGPRITRVGGRVFVTIDDEREWRNMMRNPYGRAAEVAATAAKIAHEKAVNANLPREQQK